LETELLQESTGSESAPEDKTITENVKVKDDDMGIAVFFVEDQQGNDLMISQTDPAVQ